MLFLLFLLIFLFPKITNAQVINEVFPNPSGDENIEEWIEIYNPEDIILNLEGYLLEDAAGHQLIIDKTYTDGKTILESKNFIVIKRNNSKLSLNNSDEETVYLYKDSTKSELLDTFNYNKSKENFSWGRVPDGGNINQDLLGPSPGNINNPPPTPTPTSIPTPTKTPKPTNTPKPISTSTPTPFIKATPTVIKTFTPTPVIEINKQKDDNNYQEKVKGVRESISDEDDEKEEETSENEPSGLPLASLAFILGGLSFVGAGSYPYFKKYLHNKNQKDSKINKDEKIKL